MKLLVLGGTRFLGRHLVEQALAAGHAVTLLHRGQSNAALFPQAEHCLADRNGDLAALQGGTWDVVLDTSAYFPRQVRTAAAALAGRVGRYHLVSSISAYASLDAPGTAEGAPLATLDDPTVETITGATYGGLKALCEAAAAEGFAGRCFITRPGLIVGPHDPTGRFTWWVQRFARAAPGEAVLAPGDGSAPVQFIDARDVAAFHLRHAEAGSTGVFNVTGPREPLTMGGLITALRDSLAPQAEPLWVSEDLLLAEGVAPWSELPVWLPQAQANLHRASIAAALAAGLRCRPLADTIADTAAWAATGAPAAGNGLLPAREAALLQAARHATSR